jgi:hypothetical protein
VAYLNKVKVQAGDSPSLDAFSRWRTSEPIGLFSSQSQYDLDPLQYEVGATGTGVSPLHSANTRMIALSCTAGNGTSYIQSYQYIPYQAGKSDESLETYVLTEGVAGAVVDVGRFDASNGIFLRQNGISGLQIVRRTSTSGSVVDTAVDQADWNLDKLNGTGKSGINLDVTKAQISIRDLQFLGMGRVRVGFDIDGIIIYAHEFLNANNLSVPYMQTATLPVQMLITATGTATTKTAYFKCASVSSEGGFATDLGYPVSTPEGTVTAGNGTRTPILAIRPRTTFNSLTNRSLFVLNDVDILVTGNNPILWELCVGVTYSAPPTYGNINATYSAYEYGTGGTYSTLSSGLVIASGYCPATASTKQAVKEQTSQRYPITLNRAGAVRDMGTLSLLVTGIGGTSASRATMNFIEIR